MTERKSIDVQNRHSPLNRSQESKQSHSFARSHRGRSYTLLVLAAIVTGLLGIVAPLWVSVIYGGFLFCVLTCQKQV